MPKKNRKIKENEYISKYSDIPKDYVERLNYMCDLFNISESKYSDILNKKNMMINNMEYYDFNIILYEEPEGTPRPRFRIVNRSNIINAAMDNGEFVHVYSINAHDDQVFMKRLIGSELITLNSLIYTPCIVEFNAYFKTPESFSITDKFMAEIGLIRKWIKPDWDNIGKKYSDMYNSNIWLDDSCVIEGTVRKFYSILPRVEIRLRYLNALYNKNHYNSINNRVDSNNLHDIQYLNSKGELIKS